MHLFEEVASVTLEAEGPLICCVSLDPGKQVMHPKAWKQEQPKVLKNKIQSNIFAELTDFFKGLVNLAPTI